MMTMTSDERHKVAERLRNYDSMEPPLFEIDSCIGNKSGEVWRTFSILADLIDPTCENVSDTHPSDGFTCSKCGWSGRVEEDDTDLDVYQKPMFDDFAEYLPRHCPHCGTRVVGE